MQVYVHVCGGENLVSGVSFYVSPLSFYRQDLSLNKKLTDYARLANQLAPDVLLFTLCLPYQQ